MGQWNVYISCNYSCTISFLVKILLFKLNYLYIQYTWISIMKKNKIATKIGRLKRWWYLSKPLTITITTFNFFNCPLKLYRNLKLKFRLKFNHDFTNHGCFHSAVWKALYNFTIKRAQEARHNQFFFQNVQKMRSLRSWKCLITVESTFTTKKQALVVLGLLVLFSAGNSFFGYILTKNSKLSV